MRSPILRASCVCLTVALFAEQGQAACCYFSAKNADVLQPAQKAFITWDPVEKMETFTVQPKFEGNALDFGMVIPTPSQPKLHEMPRDFFKHLAVYTIMKGRWWPYSRFPLWLHQQPPPPEEGGPASLIANKKPTAVHVLEAGVVGSLDYKIIEATRADELYQWLKDNKYSYSGDEATLNHYVQKKWIFTVMKIDTMQMKRNKDGTYAGEVTPTRFEFASDKLVYPLKITQISVKDRTEALFYVQAPYKVDLPKDNSYQLSWVPMLDVFAKSWCGPDATDWSGLPEPQAKLGKRFGKQIPRWLDRAKELEYVCVYRQRPKANRHGHTPTTLEWARKLTHTDIDIVAGKAPYSDPVPDVDFGFTQADFKDPKRRQAVIRVIKARLEKSERERPDGYLVREAPAEDIRALRQLAGHLQAGLFITKFRKIFARDEMNDDLVIVPARYDGLEDDSEYEELLPVSPP
jgi:hypothetical protein